MKNTKLMTIALCILFAAFFFPKNTLALSTPSAPTNLTAIFVSPDQIFLTWNPDSNATNYYVYRATSSSGAYTRITTTSNTSYVNTDLLTDTIYYYKVQAVNSSGLSAYSDTAYATTTYSDGSLTAPANLNASISDANQIYLSWNPVNYATYYYIYRADSLSGDYSTINITTTTNFTDFSASPNTTYYYKIQAVNPAGSSEFSSVVYATTNNNISTTPFAPIHLTASVSSSTQIDLAWDSVSYATYYYVYRSASPNGTYSIVGVPTTSNYTDSNLSLHTTYYYKVQAVNSSGSSSFSSVTYATTAKLGETAPVDSSSQVQTERLAGQDMYGTCAEVSSSGWNTSYYAVIVSGENFTDALCSAPLAEKYNGPLLLTSKDVLNKYTQSELSRLKVKKVIIIGGSGVISSAVEQTIKDMGIGVSRISGNDRYDTSLKIAQAMGQFKQAIIASGETFPDALSIAPIAAKKGIPILLTPKDTLPVNIEAYLLRTVQSTYVVGGTGVISDNVLQQLPSPKRLSGITRYETNLSIIEEFAKDLDFSTCYFSTGENYADALAGSVLASLTGSPIILVKDPLDQSTLDFVRSKMGSITKEVVFGGTVVVPESVLENINKNS